MIDENLLKAIAQQLRQPRGEHALEVGEKMNEGNRLINLHTIEALQLQNNDQVLEIGMGNGFFVKDIVEKAPAIKYIGCDYSAAMIQQAREHNNTLIKNGQVEFHLTSAESLPFGNNLFDKVFTVNTIYFWEDPKTVLSEIYRVLKPDGKITIAVRPKSDMKNYPMTKFGFKMFSKNDLSDLLKKNKFYVTEILEKKEPDQEFLETKMKINSLIFSAEK